MKKTAILSMVFVIGFVFGRWSMMSWSTTVRILAYCPLECCCEEWADGYFANGEPVGGKAIAADKSIPFGTEMFVSGYGLAKVKDRCGKGRLEVYFPTHQEALNWGVRYKEVFLSEGKITGSFREGASTEAQAALLGD